MRMRPVIYENQELEGQRLELTAKDGHYCLGPNLALRNCTLILNPSPGWIHLRSSRFTNCTIEVKSDLKNFQDWIYASLQGCRFKGRIPGCDFGNWPEYMEDAKNGGIENCDFSESRLNGCRFHGCDIRTIRFPPWPCFTLLEPLTHMSELRRVKWPGNVWEDTIEGVPARSPPTTRALTYHGPTLAKRCGVSPEELRAAIEKSDLIAC